RAELWPFSMLATSTHDTKRSEDVRSRLDVLSEMPKLWASQVFKWRKTNRTRKRMLADGRNVPDLNEEYFLYQTLLGTWPFNFSSEEDRREYNPPINQYIKKSLHTVKTNTMWNTHDPA